MPLILLCGFPCSGKSTVARRVAELICERKPEYQVDIISEEEIAGGAVNTPGPTTPTPGDTTVMDPRVSVYANANAEKQLRAQVKSKTERSLTGKKPNSIVVLVDANNCIKGYRYEMHCVAKSMRQQQAIIHCTTSEDRCRELNAKTGRYSEALFKNLVMRFECPNPAQRWDNPLFEISLPDSYENAEDEFAVSVENVVGRIITELLSSESKVKPNQSTAPIKSAASNYLQTMDKATNHVINMILVAQARGDSSLTIPGEDFSTMPLSDDWTSVILAKAKRNFLAYLRMNSGQGANNIKRITEVEAGVLFLRFLNNDAHRSAFLT